MLLTDGENTVEPGPARGGAGRAGTAASASTRSGSAARPGRRSRSKASWSTPSSTRRPCRTSRRSTDGTYYAAADEEDLASIYDDVGSRLVVRTEPFELTPLFAALGFALLLVGGVASLRWFGRMP